MIQRPLCFVLMPFGEKSDPAGGADIDFDLVYKNALAPAIDAAGMDPIRADEERAGGIIHKHMFERLLLCDYAVADLTTSNANVFYELGVRHTARPHTTLTIFANHQPIPFDVNFLRSLPYDLGENNAFGDDEAQKLRELVGSRLRDLRELSLSDALPDSPVFTLLSEWKPGDIARLKTDVFRERVRANEQLKSRLTSIREKNKHSKTREEARAELKAFREEYDSLDGLDIGTVIDFMLSYRALEDWDGMIDLYSDMPSVLQRQVLVREQLGFAYNRRAGQNKNDTDRAHALEILEAVVELQGPSSETLGLIGRIHKDRWQEAVEADDMLGALGYLEKSIDAYRRGFKSDPRDAYPGINLLTLLDIEGGETSLAEKERLLPVVSFAVEQRLQDATPDYWDLATQVELAVLENDLSTAMTNLARAVVLIREVWEPRTTAKNLRFIADSRQRRGEDTPQLRAIITELEKRAVAS